MRWTVVALALAFSNLAYAQADDARKALARDLEDRGVRAFEGGKFCDAAHLFEASDELWSASAMVYNAGRARESAGDLVGALGNYQRALETAAGTRKTELEERVARLAPQIKPPLKKCPPRPDKLTRASLDAELTPKAEEPAVKVDVKTGVGPGSDLEPAAIKTPLKEGKPGGPVIGSPNEQREVPPKATSPATWTIIAGGSVAALGLASYLGALGSSLFIPRPDDETAKSVESFGRPLEIGGYIAGSTGVALLSAGAVWALLEE